MLLFHAAKNAMTFAYYVILMTLDTLPKICDKKIIVCKQLR